MEQLREKSINLFVTDEAILNLAKKGFDPQYGGRPVKRIIQQKLLNPLSKELLSDNIQRKKQIIFDYIDSTFIFRNGELISSKD